MKEMVSFSDALKEILDSFKPIGTELIPIGRAENRVLAQELNAKVDLPSARIALRDGYAVSSSALKGKKENLKNLKLVGEILAGAYRIDELGSEEAIKVATGSVLPKNADAVIAEEDATLVNRELLISSAVEPGMWVEEQAEEFKEGEKLLDAGKKLGPEEIALLIAGGYSELTVFKKPRAWVVAVGDELQAPGSFLNYGHCYPSSAWLTAGLAVKMGAEVERVILVHDDPDAIKEVFPEKESCDILITVGGTGPGMKDLVVPSLEELGVNFRFHGVKMRPGHSTSFGEKDEMKVFCFPGRICACELCLRQFLTRAIARSLGTNFEPETLLVKCRISLSSPKGERHFIRGKLKKLDRDLWVEPFIGKKWHKEIIEADGYIVIEESKKEVKAQDELEFELWKKCL